MKQALIIVDVQNDFCKDGSLEVPNANEIIPVINHIRANFDNKFNLIFLTKDFHPKDHISFNNCHFSNDQTLELDEMTQKWRGAFPPHCIQGTTGADFHEELKIKGNEQIIRKGENKLKEAFSGFSNPLLEETLRKEAVERVFVVGLAYEFCVAYTAVDSKIFGFETFVIADACRGITESSINSMNTKFCELGVNIIQSEELIKYIN